VETGGECFLFRERLSDRCNIRDARTFQFSPVMVSPDVHSCERAVALQIDDLLGLQDRKGNRVIPVLMRVCPNEPVLFRAVGEALLDDPRGLILPLRSVRGRPDAVALVVDGRRVWATALNVT
jgi:hypothetical protein